MTVFARFRLAAGYSGLLSALLGSVPLSAVSADAVFLQDVDAEARRQAQTLLTEPPQTGPAVNPAAAVASDQLPAGLDSAGFEHALQTRLPGSYTLYQKLDAVRKQQVYQSYQRDSGLASVSEQITKANSAKP